MAGGGAGACPVVVGNATFKVTYLESCGLTLEYRYFCTPVYYYEEK